MLRRELHPKLQCSLGHFFFSTWEFAWVADYPTRGPGVLLCKASDKRRSGGCGKEKYQRVYTQRVE